MSHHPWLSSAGRPLGRAVLSRAVLLGLAVVGLVAGAWPDRLAAEEIRTTQGSGIAIDVACPFDSIPVHGAVPLRVRIRNDSSQEGVWHFIASSRYVAASEIAEFSLRVEPGQTRTFSPVVPIQGFRDLYNVGLRISVDGPAVIPGEIVLYRSILRDGDITPTLAMSSTLAASSLELLRQEMKKQKRSLAATRFDPGALPTQWRGFSGITWITMTGREWAALAPAVRNAVRQWVGTGGRLVIAAKNPAVAGRGSFGSSPYGLGRIEVEPWDGRALPTGGWVERVTAGGIDRFGGASFGHPDEEPLLQAVEEPKAGGALIFAAVIGLALLLGPFNLFYLAPAGRRHRLFVTTPLLSLGASAVLLAVIVIGDGLGGSGRRLAYIELLPGTHDAVVLQEQISRSGLLLSRRFALDDATLLASFHIPGHRDGVSVQESRFWREGVYSGDWFRSRMVQGHRLTAVRALGKAGAGPGPGPGLALAGRDDSGAPQVVSSFSDPLARLVFKDAEGKWWRGEKVRPGERVVLTAASGEEAWAFWSGALGEASGETRLKIGETHGKEGAFGLPGYFYATLENPGAGAIPTLRSIRWETRAVVTGAVETAAQKGGAQ